MFCCSRFQSFVEDRFFVFRFGSWQIWSTDLLGYEPFCWCPFCGEKLGSRGEAPELARGDA